MILRRETRTRTHGQGRILREPAVRPRQAAEGEPAALRARHDLGVAAGRAQPRLGTRLNALWSIVHDHAMFTSEASTRGIRVAVVSEYAPERSRPQEKQWFFLYTITITNEGTQTVQLLSRHWFITDGSGKVEEVRGPGVVGQQPVLKPGESFTYTSGCPLPTPSGTMEGTYQMVSPDTSERFDVKIAQFQLSEPYTVH
jgi:ApaG protein